MDGGAEGEGVNEGGFAAAAGIALSVGVVGDSVGVEGASGVDEGAVAQVALAVAFGGRVSAVVAETRVLRGASDVGGDGMGGLSVGGGEVKSRTGLAACANGTGETALASEGDSEGMVLLQSLQWMSAVRGSLLLLLLLLLLSSSTRVKSSLVSRPLPPRSYTNVPSSLMPKSLRFRRGWLRLRLRTLRLWLPWSMMSVKPMTLPSSRVGLPSMSLSGMLLLLSLGSCACSDFVIGLASPLSVLVRSVCSCIWRLFGLASVISVGGGDAAAIGEGGGGVSS